MEKQINNQNELEMEQSVVTPPVIMKKWDMWRGNLVVMKQKRIPGIGQTRVTEVQFQFTGQQPKSNPVVPQKAADIWNSTRFTARFQETDLLFPAGQKLDYWWIWNDEKEDYDFIVKELQVA